MAFRKVPIILLSRPACHLYFWVVIFYANASMHTVIDSVLYVIGGVIPVYFHFYLFKNYFSRKKYLIYTAGLILLIFVYGILSFDVYSIIIADAIGRMSFFFYTAFLILLSTALKFVRSGVLHTHRSGDSGQEIVVSHEQKVKEINERTILIKSGKEYHKAKLDDILYVEGSRNYVSFVTPSKGIMSLMSMKDAAELMPQDQFFRIHRSFIVSFKHIDVFEKELVRINKKKIPIGEKYRENLDKFIHPVGK